MEPELEKNVLCGGVSAAAEYSSRERTLSELLRDSDEDEPLGCLLESVRESSEMPAEPADEDAAQLPQPKPDADGEASGREDRVVDSNSLDGEPDEEDVAILQRDPSLTAQFEQVYGVGSARRYLGAPASAAGDAVEAAPVPEQDDIDMLLEGHRTDPSLVVQFDEFYGTGSSDRYIQQGRQRRASIMEQVELGEASDLGSKTANAAAAFRDSRFLDAVGLYEEAVGMEGLADERQRATIHVNIASALYRLERFAPVRITCDD